MDWLEKYQLFLFDFDGLLVNTEELHYEAYRRMCASRGFELPLNFEEFTLVAHESGEQLRQQIYKSVPGLQAQEPLWEVLWREKTKIYLEIIKEGSVALMPGVPELLQALKDANIASCVVTNSPRQQIDEIRRQIPLLDTIPHWLTRENYAKAKPDPECYLKAITLYGAPGCRAIGFEDTPRGLMALMGTPAEAVLVSAVRHPLLDQLPAERFRHVPTFEAIAHS